MKLIDSIRDCDRSFKQYASRLEKLNIFRLEDLLYHIPSRYEDYSIISAIAAVQPGETVTIQGTILEIKNEFTKNYKKIQKAIIADATGNIEAIWFNQPYLLQVLKPQTIVSISGTILWFARKKVIEPQAYEILKKIDEETIHTGRLVPIYPETHGVSSKWLRRKIYNLLKDNKNEILEYLPPSIQKNHELIDIQSSLKSIHFPDTKNQAEQAKKRLSFDELFLLQLAANKRRNEWNKKLKGYAFSVSLYKNQIQTLWEKLPFELTNSQKKAIEDIFSDISQSTPMNRLLEGDVGSGKTVVAAIAMYLAYLNGYQSVLMAPTEILAQQHFRTISSLLEPFGVKVGIATGNKKNYESRSKNQGDKKNKSHNSKFILLNSNILVGTQALLTEKLNFDKLGLVVIDEQQRFGVAQRSIIREKGDNPHLLTMTATPIPRTIALTLYGDLDLSTLDELPTGRKHIKTWLVPEEKRTNAYKWIEKQIKEKKDQVFIICPFIEESENMSTVKAATVEFERLRKQIFPSLKLGLLHGKLKSKEKDQILSDFKEKKYDILVATPVVEVGIDISNATIMLIEASDRFGLAQLHQLRGRVGRGEKQSYCLLFTDSKNPQTQNRLKAMELTRSGAELAELDLKLRGSGDIFGTAQHGLSQLKIASYSDFKLIEQTKKAAESVFNQLDTYPLLAKKVAAINPEHISPD